MKTEVTTDAGGSVVSTITTSEHPNSVEVSRNAKGQYSFVIKLYCEIGTESFVIDHAKKLYAQLDESFSPSEEN